MNESINKSPINEQQTIQSDPDLFELWVNLVREKKVIIFTTLMVILLGAAYAFSIKPVYQSEAYFVPVEKESIQKLADWDLLLERDATYTVQDLFKLFNQNISSRSDLWSFFMMNNLYRIYDASLLKVNKANSLDTKKKVQKAFDKFYANVKVVEPKKGGANQYFSISLAMATSEKEVQSLLADYIDQVREKTRSEILESIKNEQQSRGQQLQQQIDTLREKAKVQKSDRLAQLDEAITIARSLKLKEPPMVGAKATIQGVSNQGLPLYYLGYRLLEGERKALDERRSNDPFISGLRDLQEKLSLLSSYQISIENFATVRVDQAASIGEKIKPKKALILAGAGVLGLMLGIFIALIRIAVAKCRERDAAAFLSE